MKKNRGLQIGLKHVFSESPYQKPILVIWQIIRIFGHSLTDWQGLEGRVWNSDRHFFQYWLFSLKVVPFTQILSKSNNSNRHFRAFFMHYMNQITKLGKKIFWPNQTQSELVLEGGLRALSRNFLIPLWKGPMAIDIFFLIDERPKFRLVMLPESATCRKNSLIISKNGIFGFFTIIDQIHLGIPLQREVR